MVMPQDIGHQLMQPVKELADWSFPLSKILEMYLQEQNKINFSEAGIIVENSTTAYVHRVKNLYQQLAVLQQPLSETGDQKTGKKYERHRTSEYDLDKFCLIDMEKHIGKNINIKNENDVKNCVKLISRRFPELENFSGAPSYTPLYIYDVHGEVIGKKYDFHCTQQVDVNGILVNELTPDDFGTTHNSPFREGNMSLKSTMVDVSGTVSSGYQSGTHHSECYTTNDFTEDFDTDIDRAETTDEILQEDTHPSANCYHSEKVNTERKIDVDCTEEIKRKKRRSERLKQSINDITKFIENAWKVKNMYLKSSTPKKIQRTMTLLKNARETRKRKLPTRPSQTQSVKELVQSSQNYEAVTDSTENLLGFRCNRDSQQNSDKSIQDVSRSLSLIQMESESRASSISPELCEDWVDPDFSCSIPDYQILIEDRMNEISKECNVTTKLAEAVADWHKYLKPKLVEAEERATFHLEKYATDVRCTLSANGQKENSFDNVVRGKSSFEVSRYFLASLHLANAYNIEIIRTEPIGMELSLLEEMDRCKNSRS